MWFHLMICSEGQLTHLFFAGRDMSGVWLRLDGRRLAVPKDPRFGPPPWSFFGPKGNADNLAQGLVAKMLAHFSPRRVTPRT